MCYRPIYIYNPSRRWDYNAPLKIAVPCGRCYDCQRVKRNEYFFRSVIEYNHYKNDLKGSVYFVTLTYSDDKLPQMPLPDGSTIPAFQRTHIRSFIKYLRIWLKRHGYLYKDIKYLVCSEYGSVTKRPHYHALLFFPFHLDAHQFHSLMAKTWPHGFVICSKLGWEITSIAGIRYASKYVCKDIAFENKPELRKYLRNDKFAEWKESIKDFLPKHWQSVGFGESFCDIINKQTDIPKFLANNSYTLCVGYSNNFPIPRYYHLKFEKVRNVEYSQLLDKVVLEPTEIGLKVKQIRFEEALLKDTANLKPINRPFIDYSLPTPERFEKCFDFYKKLHPEDCNYFASQCCGLTNLSSFSYVQFRELVLDELPDMLQALDKFKLSMYRVFLRYLPIYSDEVPEHKFCELSDIIANMLRTDVYPPEYKQFFVIPECIRFATPIADNSELRNTPVCKNHPYFEQYERCTLMLDMFNFVLGLDKEESKVNRDFSIDSCKKACSPAPIIV